MAWNRSTENEKSAAQPRAARPAGLKGAIAGAVIVLGAILAFFLLPREEQRPEEIEKATPRAEVKSAVMTPVTNAVSVRSKRFWEVDASQTNGFTLMQQRKWQKEHLPAPGYTNNTSRTEKPPAYAIFKTRAENEIACYLTMEPGEALVGTPYYSPKMRKEYLEALDAPPVFDKDETPEQRELRQAVEETKKDLKARVAAGEDLFKILEDTRTELQDLGRYKADVAEQLREFRNNPDATIDDLDDFVTAANQLLEKKGIAPLHLGVITRRMLDHNRASKGKKK